MTVADTDPAPAGDSPPAAAIERHVANTARDAAVTIVGGGAIGCAVAFALTAAGYPDVQLLERGGIAEATSAQAAGLVGQVRSSVERTRLAVRSVAQFERFETQTGYPLDWRRTGSLRLALTDERVAEFERMSAVADRAGLTVEWVGGRRLAELAPALRLDAVRGALFCPTDGYLQPHSLATGFARGARDRGAHIVTGACVTDLLIDDGAVRGVVVGGASPSRPSW